MQSLSQVGSSVLSTISWKSLAVLQVEIRGTTKRPPTISTVKGTEAIEAFGPEQIGMTNRIIRAAML